LPEKLRYAPHENGTFKHRYYIDTSYYKLNGPIFLYINGESSIENGVDILDDGFIVKDLMQDFNGAGVVLETRGYGASWPYNTSTTDELRYLTTEQIIADHDYFARNVDLPGVDKSNPSKTPWIVLGASYPGALTAFTVKTYPETFLGGIASSALIHGQVEYPGFYDPIQLLAPQDCVASINAIVDNIDFLIGANNTTAFEELKALFGLSVLEDIRDFAQAIAFPIGGPLFYPVSTWQEINWNPRYGQRDFFNFCRNVTNIRAPENITSIDFALAKYTKGLQWKNLGNYAAYIKRVVLPLCASGDYNSAACFGTQHPDYWANVTTRTRRSYLYTTCTEMGMYQAAYPWGEKSLISRVIDADYTQQWCDWAFPKGKLLLQLNYEYTNHLVGKYNQIPPSPDVDAWNIYGGFNLSAKNLLFVDGSADPWREVSYHSTRAPQRYWTEGHPEHLINGAGHAWDFYALEHIEDEPQFIREAHYLELRTVETWLQEFNNSH
jgi:pimeloyl-ACP methyl ester carboxylesterase